MPGLPAFTGTASAPGDRVMQQFRDNNIQILIATDEVESIDVSGVSHINNYDTPTFLTTTCIGWAAQGEWEKTELQGVAYICHAGGGGELTNMKCGSTNY